MKNLGITLLFLLCVGTAFADSRKKPTLAQCHADTDVFEKQVLTEPTFDELQDIDNEMWACLKG